MKKPVFLIVFLSFLLQTYGQQSELLLRKKTLRVTRPLIQIDSFSIQNSFFLLQKDGKTIPADEYEVDFTKAILIFKDYKKYQNQLINVYYLTYPAFLKNPLFSYTKSSPQSADSLLLPVINLKEKKLPQPFQGLKTSGQIVRGINSGNNQSLVMQSGMELKIEGNISSNIKLKAIISDNNLPQAYAGISKSYKEFNYIYMQLTGNNWKALGGDFILDKQASYFLKFNRKIQGISLKYGKHKSFATTGGVIDGQFTRQSFHGIDGNQGPYLLKGKNGEKYIFVIKNSEKVYINGRLLQKEKDYIMDYELAQITFKPSVDISANDRISIEFNYSNQYYLKYLNYNKILLPSKKGDLEIYTYLEKDDKFRTLLFDLDKEAVESLKEAGDATNKIWIESAKKTSYNPNKILYKKIETPTETYFEFTTENLPDLYEVRFSYMGKNQGSYAIEKVTAIGKIYKYTGNHNGDYAPLIYLVPPQGNKYAGLKWGTKTGKKGHLKTDILVNNSDKNLFSPLNDNDNTGFGTNIEYFLPLIKDSVKQWDFSGNYRFVHQNFVPLDPYTDPEFLYRWQIDSLYGQQHFFQAATRYKTANFDLKSGVDYLGLNRNLNAYTVFLSGEKKWKKFIWRGNNSFLYQNLPGSHLDKTNFDNSMEISLGSYIWKHQIHYEKRNKKTLQIPDSLNFGYYFYQSTWSKKTSPGNEFEMGLRFSRNDSIQHFTYEKARSALSLFFRKNFQYQNGKLSFSGRIKEIDSKTETIKNYYNLGFSWQQKWIKKSIESHFKIESYNGNILRDEVVFVETPPGQGRYQWNDYNANGLKEINEFEIAVFSDQARYIKVILPSKNLVPVKNNLYSFSLNIKPSAFLKKSFLKKTFNRFVWKTNHQTPATDNKIFEWMPSNALLNYKHIQNDFYINRSKKKYRFHFLYQYNQNQQWLIIGKQGITNERYKWESMHTFNKQLIWQQSLTKSYMKQFSENYAEKNFHLKQWEMEENLSWYKKNRYQWKFFYQWKDKKSFTGNEKLKMNAAGINYLLFPKKKHSLYLQGKYVYNKFNGLSYTPVAFYMLEGLQKGKNILMEFNYRQKLNSYLEMNLNYQYRKPELHKGIHTGGIQFKMFF